MSFNFDEEIVRLGTHSVKWEFISQGDEMIHGDFCDRKHGPDRLLPLWVAYMDFQSPPAVIEALVARARHGIFGYTRPADSYYEAVLNWCSRRYGWMPQREWNVITPGVVPAINMLIQTLIEPQDKVLIQRPVYYPFMSAIENNCGVVVSNSLTLVDSRYEMDFADLEEKTADPAVKLAILCHPHNPVGRLWTVEELTQFGEICLKNGVFVISDEIHCDLVYDGQRFVPFASLDERFAWNSATCMAASKTFNLAGLKTSNIFIPNPTIRAGLEATMTASGIWGANAFGIVATEAAYNHGEEWLAAVMKYVQGNLDFMKGFFAEHFPRVEVIQPEGTYLVWVDFRSLGLAPAERKAMIMEEARIYLDEGELFGPEGEGFERFNLACSRAILAEALARLKRCLDRRLAGQG